MERYVGIIGLGLMGGSLGLAMQDWPGKTLLLGYDLDPQSAQKALERGAVNQLCPSAEAVTEASDLLFIAVPVRTVPEILFRIAPHLKPDTIVFDLASSREWILQETAALAPELNYAGFHPMCGKERGGIGEARGTLYRNAPILVTPQNPPHRIAEMARRVITFLGGKVFFYTLANTTWSVL